MSYTIPEYNAEPAQTQPADLGCRSSGIYIRREYRLEAQVSLAKCGMKHCEALPRRSPIGGSFKCATLGFPHTPDATPETKHGVHGLGIAS
jgi:hypothetical protein